MKQHITPEQLNELSEKGRNKLSKWFIKKYGAESFVGEIKKAPTGHGYLDGPILSIGQMIEFLEEHDKKKIIDILGSYSWQTGQGDREWTEYSDNLKDICDKLWQAVKEVLEE